MASGRIPDEIIDRVLVNPDAPPSERVYDWNRLEQDTDEVLEVVVDEEGDEESEYYLLAREAPADEPVETITAENVTFAAERFLLDAIKSQIPVPPWKEGEPQRRPDPELRVVVGEENEYLVGEVDWPDEAEMTHGMLWGTFTDKEVGYVERLWAYLQTDPRPAPPEWPP